MKTSIAGLLAVSALTLAGIASNDPQSSRDNSPSRSGGNTEIHTEAELSNNFEPPLY